MTKEEKDQMTTDFACGFHDGTATRGYKDTFDKLSKAYLEGYNRGTVAWRKAIDEYREEIGNRLTTEIND
jgi:hypothetical protein